MTFFSIRKYFLFCFVSFSHFLAFTYFVFLDFSIIFRTLWISSRQQSESGGRLFLAKVEFPYCLARITFNFAVSSSSSFSALFLWLFLPFPTLAHSLIFSFGWMSIYWWAACPNNHPNRGVSLSGSHQPCLAVQAADLTNTDFWNLFSTFPGIHARSQGRMVWANTQAHPVDGPSVLHLSSDLPAK